MSVRIRLKKCFRNEGYDVIVTSNGQIKGNLLDTLGYYSPHGKENFVYLDVRKFEYWLTKGATCSERVLKLWGFNSKM